MVEPTKIPMITHNRSPKIEVGFDSSVLITPPLYADMVLLVS